MSTRPTLSVAVACSNPTTMDFPFKECIRSVLPIADEVVVINGDENPVLSEVACILDEVRREIDADGLGVSIKTFHLPWQEHMRKNMEVLAKTAAISQCSCDYVLLLDADEVIHEKDYAKIVECMERGLDAYSFSTLHFYRDYDKVKDYDDHWYNYRPKLFKNGLGIWDGPQSYLHTQTGHGGDDFNSTEVITEYTADLVTWDYDPVHTFSQKVNVEIYHYGWVRNMEDMLIKQNKIERRYHPGGDTQVKQWQWDMSGTKEFTGTHPAVMEGRTNA